MWHLDNMTKQPFRLATRRAVSITLAMKGISIDAARYDARNRNLGQHLGYGSLGKYFGRS